MQELLAATAHILKGILGPLVLFGFVVFIHELGHFVVAKMAGVGVKKFAIGFGPKIFSWVRGETEYSVRWIPLGGFVALKGMIEGLEEEDEKEDATEDPDSQNATPEGDPEIKEEQTFHITEDLDALRNRSAWVRIAVFGAGVACNFLTAIVFCALFLWHGYPKPIELTPRLESVSSDSPWYAAGWRTGDEILSVEKPTLNGLRPTLQADPYHHDPPANPVEEWEDVWEGIANELEPVAGAGSSTINALLKLVGLGPDAPTTRTISIRVARNGEELVLPWSTLLFRKDPETFSAPQPPYVAAFTPNSPAHRARLMAQDYEIGKPIRPIPTWEEMPEMSLQPDDTILAINAGIHPEDMQEVHTWREMTTILRNHPREAVQLLVERKDRESARRLLLLTVLERSEADPQRGVLGIYPGLPTGHEREKKNLGAAIAEAPIMALQLTDQIVYQTALMLTRSWREISRNVGGPVLIGILASKSAQKGLSNYLRLFAVISIVLAVMNLLPIPVLDGGYILITIIEAIIGRRLPPKFLATLLTVFMVLFMVLFALIFYNDFMNWVIRI